MPCFRTNGHEYASIIKKTGGQGLRVTAVRVYAYKLLKALYHLERCNIIHADIKPDNILIDKGRTNIKLADLGSAMEVQEAEPMPLLVSRFYRPPEVILGINFSLSLDVFSFGCCLYEFATGRPLLRSEENNHHLKLIFELKGAMPKRLVQKARFREQYFDVASQFLELVPDPVDRSKTIVRKHRIEKSTRDITQELKESDPNADETEKKQIVQLSNLIQQCLDLDPEKRITPKMGLKHPVFEEGPVVPIKKNGEPPDTKSNVEEKVNK